MTTVRDLEGDDGALRPVLVRVHDRGDVEAERVQAPCHIGRDGDRDGDLLHAADRIVALGRPGDRQPAELRRIERLDRRPGTNRLDRSGWRPRMPPRRSDSVPSRTVFVGLEMTNGAATFRPYREPVGALGPVRRAGSPARADGPASGLPARKQPPDQSGDERHDHDDDQGRDDGRR